MPAERHSGDGPTDSERLEELVAEAAGGDRTAQQTLLVRYWQVIRQVVRARKNRLGERLSAREETQDLQQAAALRVLSQLDDHRWQGKSAFVAWVKKLAQVEVIDWYRHHSAQKRDVAVETGEEAAGAQVASLRSAESRLDDQRELDELLAQVEALKPEYGAALMMHHMGFSHAQIGEALKCTPEAARKLVARARIKLLAARGSGQI